MLRALRALIILTFLIMFVPSSLFAQVWYVRIEGGHYGAENGTSYENAWDGFSNIAWDSMHAGDSLYVCGEHNESLTIGASGESNNLITISGDCPGDPGVINPVSVISGTWVADQGVGSGVYKLALGYNPLTIVHNGKRLGRINSSYMGVGGDGWDWLAKESDATEPSRWQSIEIPFWEPVKAIFGYADPYTYIRWGDETDPNTLNLYGNSSKNGITLSSKNYVKVMELTVKNANYGIYVTGRSNGNVIDACTLVGSNDGILIYNDPTNTKVTNNTLYSNFYGADGDIDWGAWEGGTDTQSGIKEQLYEWYRHRLGSSEFSDTAIRTHTVGNGTTISNNTIYNRHIGIWLDNSSYSGKSTISITKNNIDRTSYLGILILYGYNATIEYNTLTDCAISMRIHQLQNYADNDRILYVSNNLFRYSDVIGKHFFWHTYAGVGTQYSTPATMVFSENTFRKGYRFMQIGDNDVRIRSMLSNTSFESNVFTVQTINSDFDDEKWKLIDGNTFYYHEVTTLPSASWMGTNFVLSCEVAMPLGCVTGLKIIRIN